MKLTVMDNNNILKPDCFAESFVEESLSSTILRLAANGWLPVIDWCPFSSSTLIDLATGTDYEDEFNDEFDAVVEAVKVEKIKQWYW